MQSNGWKSKLAAGLYRCGVFGAMRGLSRRFELLPSADRTRGLRRARRAKYAILAYHSVGPGLVPLYCRLSQSAFAEQMRYIRRHYRVLSLSQMVEELSDPESVGQGVVVTFDDGYRSNYTQAFPVLQQYSIPATVYLIAGAIENDLIAWYDRIFLAFHRIASASVTLDLGERQELRLNSSSARIEAATAVVRYLRTLDNAERLKWCAEFETIERLPEEDLHGWMLTWEQIRMMQRSGIHFGGHTMSHPVVSRLSPQDLRAELIASKQMIESRLENPIEDFAFPFGQPTDCGKSAGPILRENGYRSAVTTVTGINREGHDRFDLQRILIDEMPISMFAYHLSRLFF